MPITTLTFNFTNLGQIWPQYSPRFPNCKQIFCITTFELLCTSLQSLLHNMVVESVRFALL